MGDTDQPQKRRRGRPPRTPDERAAQRLRLTVSAMAAVRDGGGDVSIDDLAAAAGVSKPVLYDEFGDKNGIADAIAVTLAEELERQVLAEVNETGEFTIEAVVGFIVEALVDLIVREPELYAFIVRAIRTSDRGFLDNALVRVIHERAAVLVKLVAPAVPDDHLSVLIDGVFGFAFASIESWQGTNTPPRDEFVDDLSRIISAGIDVVASRFPAS